MALRIYEREYNPNFLNISRLHYDFGKKKGWDYTFMHDDVRSGREVTFLGNVTSIDSLLAMLDYKPLAQSILSNKGAWELFENKTDRLAMFLSDKPFHVGDWHFTDSNRLLVKSSGKQSLDEFVHDIEIMTVAGIEKNYKPTLPDRYRNAIMWEVIGGAIFSIALPPLLLAQVALVAGTAELGARRWQINKYLNKRLQFKHLSQKSNQYELFGDALNSLKADVFNKLLDENIATIPQIRVQECQARGSVSALSIGQKIAIGAIPIAAYKTPYSQFDQGGKMQGSLQGTYSGSGYFSQSGHFSGSIDANYDGSGDIRGIRSTTPIEYLMQDKEGNQFLVWGHHIAEPLKQDLERVCKIDYTNQRVEGIRSYASIAQKQLNNHSLHNAHIFYGDILLEEQMPLSQRNPIEIYAEVMHAGELPIVQLVGFKNRKGNTILLQPYSAKQIFSALSGAGARLGHDAIELNSLNLLPPE